MSEDDTFRILARCTYEEMIEILHSYSAAEWHHLGREGRLKVYTDNHWTVEEVNRVSVGRHRFWVD